MCRVLSIFLLLIMAGCVPHFYRAKALTVDAEDISILSSGKLNKNCIGSAEIPLAYELKKELYVIEFYVSALQLGMRFRHSDIADSKYEFSAPNLRKNEPHHTKLDAKYTHYIPVPVPKIVVLNVESDGKVVGSEQLSLDIRECTAVAIDAI